MSGPSFTWAQLSTSWWRHELPDTRTLEVRMVDERWMWAVYPMEGCAGIYGWSKTFDAAKMRAILAWRDTTTAEHREALSLDAINHLTRGAA